MTKQLVKYLGENSCAADFIQHTKPDIQWRPLCWTMWLIFLAVV